MKTTRTPKQEAESLASTLSRQWQPPKWDNGPARPTATPQIAARLAAILQRGTVEHFTAAELGRLLSELVAMRGRIEAVEAELRQAVENKETAADLFAAWQQASNEERARFRRDYRAAYPSRQI